jgi:hypothetical protein
VDAQKSVYAVSLVSARQQSTNNILPISGAVTVSGTVSATMTAGSALAGDVSIQYRAGATGAASITKLISAATTNPTVMKASAGKIIGYQLQNTTASIVYVKMHNIATTPTAGTTPVLFPIAIPANGKAEMSFEGGLSFPTGIALTTVTGAADADATSVAANAIVGSLFFA